MSKAGKTLTVVIPTYNMERYLRRCLDSLIVGDEMMRRLEVLVINDGSKDASSPIAHEYQERWPQTFRVIDKENGNYGSCVNRGLREATGKYIKILDADDWFDTGNLNVYIGKLGEIDADLVITDYVTVNPRGYVTGGSKFSFKPGEPFLYDDVKDCVQFKNLQMHVTTYRTQNLVNIGYRQTEGISYTDQEWMFLPMTAVNKAYYFDLVVYNYLVGREGQTRDPNVMKRSLSHTIKGAFAMFDIIRSSDSPRTDYLIYRACKKISGIYLRSLTGCGLSNDELAELDREVEDKCAAVYNALSDEPINRRYGFKFIAWWRDNNHKKLPATVLLRLNVIYALGALRRKSRL